MNDVEILLNNGDVLAAVARLLDAMAGAENGAYELIEPRIREKYGADILRVQALWLAFIDRGDFADIHAILLEVARSFATDESGIVATMKDASTGKVTTDALREQSWEPQHFHLRDVALAFASAVDENAECLRASTPALWALRGDGKTRETRERLARLVEIMTAHLAAKAA